MRLRNFLPQTLMGRSLLILVVPVILAQIIAVTVFWDNHWDKMTRRLADAVSGEIAIIADQLENNYSREHYEVLAAYLKKHLDVTLFFEEGERVSKNLPKVQESISLYKEIIISPLRISLDYQLPNHPHTVYVEEGTEEVEIYVALQNGLMQVTVSEKRLFSSSGYVFIILLVVSSFTLLAISIIFLRNQIRPIRKLAAAVSLMGKGRFASIGSPKGAREVRQASEAFETMQRRIRRQMEQRTAMLAGVSHDLRTPLTRVKLGLSMIDDQKEAQTMLADLDEMEKMIDAYLEFARGEKLEEAVSMNLKEFIEDILQSYKTAEFDVEFKVSGTLPVMPIQKINFRRALENIFSNASRYASKLQVSLEMTETRLYLKIEDNGPGISKDQYEEALKPFVRLDPSRSKNTGGAGLGLSVAADIVLSHGGKISLSKSKELGGLCVFIRLPV